MASDAISDRGGARHDSCSATTMTIKKSVKSVSIVANLEIPYFILMHTVIETNFVVDRPKTMTLNFIQSDC